jgi:PAS fold
MKNPDRWSKEHTDMEWLKPVLEAIPDGAIAVAKDGTILHANRFMSENTGIHSGMTLAEIVQEFDVRAMDVRALTLAGLPEARVLAGEDVREALVRLWPPGAGEPVVLLVNGRPVHDVVGRVVAAVMVSRPISLELALAIQVRQLSAQVNDHDAVRV